MNWLKNESIIMESICQLAEKAIEFDHVERIRLVDAILNSLDKPDHDIRLIRSPD